MLLKLCLTLIVACIGAIIALKLKIPAGAVIGSLALVGIFSIFTGLAYIPLSVKTVTQAVAGAFIGISVKKKDIEELKLIIVPSLIFLAGVFMIGLTMGYMMFRFTAIDAPTSFLACVPAGITDISLISHDLGADGAQVAVLQLIRLILAIGITPLISKKILSRLDQAKPTIRNHTYIQSEPQKISGDAASGCSNKGQKTILTLLAAAVGGFVGFLLGIPAGAMTVSMFAVSVLSVKFDLAYLPARIRTIAQICAGTLIGVTVTMDTVYKLKNLVIPALIIVAGCLAINYGLGFLIYRFCGIDLATMLFASTPAGLSDMALIATDVGGDAPKVAVFQLVRFIGILTFMPSIVKYLCSLLA